MLLLEILKVITALVIGAFVICLSAVFTIYTIVLDGKGTQKQLDDCSDLMFTLITWTQRTALAGSLLALVWLACDCAKIVGFL